VEITPALRFCANLKWLFTERPFLERLEAAAKAGFSAVEYASPYDFDVKTQRRLLDDLGLKLILINTPAGAPGTPTSSGNASHPDAIDAFRAETMKAIEYADLLGSTLIHLMAGIVPPGVSRESARDTYIENVAWAAGMAAKSDVKLVLEAVNQRDVPGFFLRTLEEAEEVITLVGSTHVGLLFDVYHCQVSQGDLAMRMRRLMPSIAHIQVADPPYRSEPGTGEIAWPFVFDQITELGYRGWIGCEYRPTGVTEAGLDWLKRVK
jgi:hydroxypyruvate isomerase